MTEVEESKKLIKFLEEEISNLYSKIALLESEKQCEEKHLREVCPHTETGMGIYGDEICNVCGKNLT